MRMASVCVAAPMAAKSLASSDSISNALNPRRLLNSFVVCPSARSCRAFLSHGVIQSTERDGLTRAGEIGTDVMAFRPCRDSSRTAADVEEQRVVSYQ